MVSIKVQKLDFDKLYEEAEKKGRFGTCLYCEEDHMLCWCGVCFKYCHSDYFHESFQTDPMEDKA